MVYNYFKILFYFNLIGFITLILIFFVLFLNFLKKRNLYRDKEQLSSYECGFQPFAEARTPFDIKFYLISIFFLIFDSELIFLIPGVLSFFYFSFFEIFIIILFLFILILGFFIE
jgi:NADH-quinone oxidoreductase subunit A